MAHNILMLCYFIGCVSVISSTNPENVFISVLENDSDPNCLEKNNMSIKLAFHKYEECLAQCQQDFVFALYTTGDILEASIDVLCKSTRIKDCLNDLQKTVETCLNEENNKLLKDAVKSLLAGLKTACGVDGEPIRELVTKGDACMKSSKALLNAKECTKREFKSQSVEIKSLKDLFKEEVCYEAKEYLKCITSAFASCEDDTVKKFFENVFNSILKNSYCSEFIKSF